MESTDVFKPRRKAGPDIGFPSWSLYLFLDLGPIFLLVLLDHKFLLFIYLFIYLFLEREGEVERQGEKHQCVVTSYVPPTGDLALNPGMCPDWESNRQPFGSQAGTRSTEPHQPGQITNF